MTEKKELKNEELEKVTGGYDKNIKHKYVCNACGEDWKTSNMNYRCKYCGSTNIKALY